MMREAGCCVTGSSFVVSMSFWIGRKQTLGNMNEFQYVIKADEISIFICLPRIQICKAFSKGIDLLIS